MTRIRRHGVYVGFAQNVNGMKYIARLLLLAGLMMVAVSCGDPAAGGGRSAVFLIVESANWGIVVDVYEAKAPHVSESYITDVKVKSEKKDPSSNTPLSVYSDVILTQYTITYWRIDGNPTVPAPVSFGIHARVPAGGTYTFKDLEIMTRDAKLRSPLKELAFGGGEGTIELNALIKFYGKDLSGNAVTAEYNLDITAKDA